MVPAGGEDGIDIAQRTNGGVAAGELYEPADGFDLGDPSTQQGTRARAGPRAQPRGWAGSGLP